MWIKICGNTNLEDAALAAELGANAVGFVFAASKRQVTREQVAAITPHLPPTVELVGVFDSHDPEEIAQTAWHSGLTAIQLHGGLDDDLSETLAERLAGSVRIIQTLHWAVNPPVDPATAPSSANGHSPFSFAAQLEQQIIQVAASGIADRVLIDSKVGAATGGTGVSYDWLAAREAFASAPSGLRLIVAGGLRPDNVARAIAQLQPWGVDVASGVELAPGRKDPARLAAFINNARLPSHAPSF
jgi:phosphoribosylanthranilate isomerase